MKKPNISPGPWHLGIKPGPYIYGPKGEQVAACDSITNFAVENIANSKAIAAVPLLLDALEALMQRAMSGLDQSATHDGLTNCDAIAKARSALLAAGYTD